jgi:glycosyltransferase involved in cell wall biosynthesis
VKILFLNPTGQMGGAETALIEVMAGLADRHPSWTLGLVVASGGPLVARARALGADVRVLPFHPSLARLGERSSRERRRPEVPSVFRAVRVAWPLWRYRAALRRLIREVSPDIVHSNGLKMHVLGALATPAATPLVCHLHDYISARPLGARALAHCAPQVAAVIAPSHSVAADFRSLRGILPPVHTIANAVDLARFSPRGETLDLDARAGLSAPDGRVMRVGLVATFAWWKGHRIFLEAIARLPASLPVRAYVIGGAVYETSGSQVSIEELREEAARLGLRGRVGFTGFVGDPAPAIRALDVLVHASTAPEPFGLAIAEGMACGRAVAVTYRGGACELVTPGRDAIVCAPGDPAALARCIEQLLGNDGLRQRLGRAARATAERRFDRRRLASEIVGVYERVAPHASGDADARLRVLHVHSGNLYGGVETFLATVAGDTASRPLMASSFALCFEGRFSAQLQKQGHRPYQLGAVRVSRPHTVWRARRALTRLLHDRRFDVVVCHEAWAHAIFAPAVRRCRLPLVFWRHTTGNRSHWLERWAQRMPPDVAVANSRFTAGNLSRTFPATPIEILYCPVGPLPGSAPGTGQREAIRRSLDTPDEDVVVVQVGRLESSKGYRETLAALAALRDVPTWRYWIVGGPQRRSDERHLRDLRAAVRRWDLGERVRFAGERHDVPLLLQAADVYCQPNVSPEAFGLTLVEAQRAALPVVASAIGGSLEIVDEATGLLVPPGDIAALAAALRRLLGDAGLRARLGQAGRVRADMLCDHTRQLQRTCAVLSRAAGRPDASFVQHLPALESVQP